MSIKESINYVHEPTPLQCGQAVLAMLSGKTVNEIIEIVKTDKETTLNDMFSALNILDIKYNRAKTPCNSKKDLPRVCFLSLETPRCWHWSLYFDGTFYDPEHGISNDFPECSRKYFWEII